MIRLLENRMADGSRHFFSMPESCTWKALSNHLGTLPQIQFGQLVSDDVIEMWLDFSFQGHEFTVNNPLGEFWFFVKHPGCPDAILTAVAEKAAQLQSLVK